MVAAYHIAKADFLQRVRNTSFLVILGICILGVYLYVPPQEAAYTTLTTGNYRGIYNSSWIGCMIAMMSIIYLSLFGFYLINSTVKKDEDTGIGQIIAAAPVSKRAYLYGKWLSNAAVLLTMVMMVAVMAIFMFFWRGEIQNLELWKLLSPLLHLTVPAVFITAALATAMEILGMRKRGLMNISYFLLWYMIMGTSMFMKSADVFGFQVPLHEIKLHLKAHYPDYNGQAWIGFQNNSQLKTRKTFTWNGPQWSIMALLLRLFWMLAAIALFTVSMGRFKRFDPTYKNRSIRGSPVFWEKSLAFLFKHQQNVKTRSSFLENPDTYTQLLPLERRFKFIHLFKAELTMMAMELPSWQIPVYLALFVFLIFSPMSFAYKTALPVFWFIQVSMWSKIGCRETMHSCTKYIFSAAYPVIRQLPAHLFAALLTAILTALPVLVKLLVAGNYYCIFAILTGALFLISLAFASGTWTGGSKFFEVIYGGLFIGQLEGIPYVDYLGAFEKSRDHSMVIIFLIISAILLMLSVLGRLREIKV